MGLARASRGSYINSPPPNKGGHGQVSRGQVSHCQQRWFQLAAKEGALVVPSGASVPSPWPAGESRGHNIQTKIFLKGGLFISYILCFQRRSTARQ